MSNFDRAVKALNDVGEYIDYLEGNIAYVTALEAAGLLAPDLPNPARFNHRNELCWETEGNTNVRTPGMLPISLKGPFEEGWDMHPPEARDIAYALLAACEHVEKLAAYEYAEKEQDNE